MEKVEKPGKRLRSGINLAARIRSLCSVLAKFYVLCIVSQNTERYGKGIDRVQQGLMNGLEISNGYRSCGN